jgi:RNA polymerase sigma factor (sigma-70 family)
MTTDSQQPLAEYVRTGSEAAFQEVVRRYLDLVYSTASRMVNGDAHLAQDVAQIVFTDLARMARTLKKETMLGGWLHRHTCYVASKLMRSERRRLAREKLAVEMNSLEDHSEANLSRVAPILDDAINRLGSDDRRAILLRFYEQKDFRSVGEAMGSNEEAARKRVDRALVKLESLMKKQGVTLSAAALGAALAAQAVTAAPAGMIVTISGAALTSAAAGGGTTLTILKIMSITKTQIAIVSAVVLVAITAPLVITQQHTRAKLREANESLRVHAQENSRLSAENQQLSNQLVQATTAQSKPSSTPPTELLKLRSEVGQLRRENASAAAAMTNSPLSGLRANPEMWELIRKGQRQGLASVYKDFTNRMNLPPEQGDNLFDLLSDNVMENIDRVTEVLRDGISGAQMDAVFSAQDAAMNAKIEQLLGPEGAAKYKEYTTDIGAYLSAQQFKSMMTGSGDDKEVKVKQLFQLLQTERSAVLAANGLPADYQIVPTLNLRNIASEDAAEKNLKLLQTIYVQAASKAGGFLTPDDIKKFGEFGTLAINNSRMTLAVNRKMMAPAGK